MWDDETDMNALEISIRSISRDGLIRGNSCLYGSPKTNLEWVLTMTRFRYQGTSDHFGC